MRSPPGSSPLARGLHRLMPRTGLRTRIIPARAGFTRAPGPWRTGVGDHPRSRGVYAGSVQCGASTRGSSPLARGLPNGTGIVAASVGIIPARAGFTHALVAGPLPGEDHPRSRGVYVSISAVSPSMFGSSPLARGLHIPPCPDDGGTGIIPARAGFTAEEAHHEHHDPDHPRSRGVYHMVDIGGPAAHGSSPLARGLLDTGPEAVHPVGIIPARAGFTLRNYLTLLAAGGSSPLARGLPPQVRSGRPGARIIPARAGFTPSRPPPGRSSPDHPRSRGVYMSRLIPALMARGSSPLARGLHLLHRTG